MRKATLLLGLLVITSPDAQVPTGGAYSLPKQVIASGGNRASGGDYVLTGTLGQAATGLASGGASSLQQGFHHGAPAAPAPDAVFKNGFE